MSNSPNDQAGTGGASVVAFEHRFFKSFPDIFFYLPELASEPVAMIKLGGQEVALGFPGIKSEFSIADESPDGMMLDLVAKGLTFVKGLRLGDPIPREVLTREASWELSERHREIAYHRLTLQLVSWIAGDEHVITNPEELLQVADDPITKRKINQAFGETAERLELGRDRKEEVIDLIETLSKELAYIEALREMAQQLETVERKSQILRRMFGHERSVLEIADPVARLARFALEDFRGKFEEIDAQTAEIMAVLKNIQNQIDYIRTARDNLYRRLVAWEEIFKKWNEAKLETSPENEDLLRETYRFLAPRFMQVSEWILLTKIAAGTTSEQEGQRRKGVEIRDERPLMKIVKW